jgi:hypothetical protein
MVIWLLPGPAQLNATRGDGPGTAVGDSTRRPDTSITENIPSRLYKLMSTASVSLSLPPERAEPASCPQPPRSTGARVRAGGEAVRWIHGTATSLPPASNLVLKPSRKPKLTSARSSFRMTDFLTFAGVDPASRGGD